MAGRARKKEGKSAGSATQATHGLKSKEAELEKEIKELEKTQKLILDRLDEEESLERKLLRKLSKKHDKIIEKVLKQRMVKKSTIILMLTNKNLFKKLPDGRYDLAEKITA